MLSGSLFIYHPDKKLAAFASHSSSLPSRLAVILIAGLSDGLLTLPYTEALAAKLSEADISFIMPLLSSSYSGYGTNTLAVDAEELGVLLHHCQAELKLHSFVLMGHSTGCQDIITLMSSIDPSLAVHIKGLILQGPVSDRQYIESLAAGQSFEPSLSTLLQHCRQSQSQGNSDELLPIRATRALGLRAPMTAERFYDLASPDGADDLFSIDEATCSKLQAICGCIACPILIFLSEKDEFVPREIKTEHVVAWFQKALGSRSLFSLIDKIVVLKEARHSLENYSPKQLAFGFVQLLCEWIQNVVFSHQQARAQVHEP